MKCFQSFWIQNPGLLYALCALIGLSAALQFDIHLLFPLLIIAFSVGLQRRLVLAMGLLIAMYGLVTWNYQFPSLPHEGVSGTAYFDVQNFGASSSSFGKRWIYKGVLRNFTTDNGSIAKNISASVSLPFDSSINRPLANGAYLLDARLKQSLNGKYILSVKKETIWHPVVSSWSLAEWRYAAKQAVAKYLHQYIHNDRVSAFLIGIATGDFDDKLMQHEFSRFGLQHIMAISGFHFAIIAGILSFWLRLMVSKKIAHIVLIFLLSSYFLFLGAGPSVIRAWIAISIALIGFLLERRGTGINSLGIALLVVIIIDPLAVYSIGFQFSFVTTAAILLMYPQFDLLMQKIFAKRYLSEVVEMDIWNQHAYCLLTFIRQGIALTLAVNLVAFPLMLFYFQKFPLLSLIYNLFFPFLVSLSMVFLILGILGMVIFQPLGQLIFAINERYTQYVLNFTYNMPTNFDVIVRVSQFQGEFLIYYLTLVFGIGIYALQMRQEVKAYV